MDARWQTTCACIFVVKFIYFLSFLCLPRNLKNEQFLLSKRFTNYVEHSLTPDDKFVLINAKRRAIYDRPVLHRHRFRHTYRKIPSKRYEYETICETWHDCSITELPYQEGIYLKTLCHTSPFCHSTAIRDGNSSSITYGEMCRRTNPRALCNQFIILKTFTFIAIHRLP